MQTQSVPAGKELVLVGGGHSHVAVLKSFGMRPMPGVRVTLISNDAVTPYSGMLPGFVAGQYSFDDCHIDLVRLSRFAAARFYCDEAVGIDLAAKRVVCAGRPPVRYDVLSLDIGSRPRRDEIPGAAEHATPVKPIAGFVARWEHIVRRVAEDERGLHLGVVGGGAGGVELVLAMQHYLRRLMVARGRDPERLRFTLVTADGVLPSHNRGAGRILSGVMSERGIRVLAGCEVMEVGQGSLRCSGGRELKLDEILWVTQAGAAPWLGASGLETDSDGFVKVRSTLQTVSDASVFAAGDVASVEGQPRPKAGVFAVRQGPPLSRNLRLELNGSEPQPFELQKRFLSLISTGDKNAVASWGPLSLEAQWLWRLKDAIDRRFMDKYSRLPDMPQEAAAPAMADEMRCGGCGAKVGGDVLARVMARLRPITRGDVVVGLADGDDAAIMKPPASEMLQLQTVDFFRAFVDDPYVFGRIAANHALGDIYAMGGQPATALAIATVPFGPDARVEEDLFQMMSGAVEVLNEAGCALVGGHSGEGAELALGFAVTGEVRERDVMGKGGLGPSQALILTKALGTGTLLASAMRNRARGRWIRNAIRSMQTTSRHASACLRRFGAAACTDVTGFGLAGHLSEMTVASGVGAEISLSALPLLDGAVECAAQNIFSTLHPQNRKRIGNFDIEVDPQSNPRLELCFDPQTAGGLLAGVPIERSAECLAELKSLGCSDAAIIGHTFRAGPGPGRIRIVA